MMELLAGNIKEAWKIFATTKPCHASMERQTVEREELYDFQASPGEHILSNRDPTPLPDEAPPDAEIRTVVKALRNGRTGGGSMMRAEHLKAWLRWAKEEEEAEKEGTEGLEGVGDTWRLLVQLIQHIWDTGEIPSRMLLTIIVLILIQGELWGLPRDWLA